MNNQGKHIAPTGVHVRITPDWESQTLTNKNLVIGQTNISELFNLVDYPQHLWEVVTRGFPHFKETISACQWNINKGDTGFT